MKDKNCSLCHSLTEIKSHLHELAVLTECFYGENRLNFLAMNQWLTLSSTLDNVEINPYLHDRSSLSIMCRPHYEALDSDRKYFSAYTTELTRLFFVCNALEEVYRFVSTFFTDELNTSFKNPVRDNSMKSLILFDKIEEKHLPKHFEHYNQNLCTLFERYTSLYNKKVNNKLSYPKEHRCYALNIIRNIRNDIAHGVIPINLNPEYGFTGDNWKTLYFLIQRATRTILLYIQAFLSKYGNDFDMEEYYERVGYVYWLESKDIRNECTESVEVSEPADLSALLSELHLKSGFGYYRFIDLSY
jgi:hypothetical protein|nr:MAG TPA: hypothetical protein [Caudoviricetes sp.]